MRFAIINTLVLVLLSGAAFAGPLAEDPHAVYWDDTLWCGTTVMRSDVPNIEGDYLQATIDWCVYAPGQFSYPDLGYTPTSNEFVYAYQVYVDPDVELIEFSVGLLESSKADNIGSFLMTDGVAPTSIYFGGEPVADTANWRWANSSPLMPPGAKSYGLAYSSVNAPLIFIGSIQNSGLGAMGEIPSPSDTIPEPVTLGLLLVGAIAGGLRRNRR